MTIEAGESWGEPWLGPPVGLVADDAELARAVAAADEVIELTPLRGDLLRTIGVDRPRQGGERHRYPIDIGVVRLVRSEEVIEASFAAHLTIRNRPLAGFGPGLSVAVMNAAWMGPLRLGPRAHPNDGLLDVTEGFVGWRQRREANRRARSGAHLPHPRLRVRRTASWAATFRRPVAVWLDGVRAGRFDSVEVHIEPDAAAIVA